MRRFARSLAVVALSVGGVLFGSLGAGAQQVAHASSPTVTLSQSTGLTNGQSISVTGTGFTPGDTVYVIECYASATNQSGCDVGGAMPATIDSSGNLPATSFTVTTGYIGSTGNGGTCGTSASDLSNCVVAVANASGGDQGAAPITFAAPTASTTTTTTPGKSHQPKKHVKRRIFLHPKAGLRDNQAVRVTGRGFASGPHVIVQCQIKAKSQAQCDLSNVVTVNVGNNGRFRAIFHVHTGSIGTGSAARFCGTKPNNRNRCEVSVANTSGTDSAVLRFAFRK